MYVVYIFIYVFEWCLGYFCFLKLQIFYFVYYNRIVNVIIKI